MFQTKFVEEIKTRILCSIAFISKIVPFMRYCGKNIVQPDRLQETTWRNAHYMLPKATDAHSECVTLAPFPL
jgi:hypothetical protein